MGRCTTNKYAEERFINALGTLLREKPFIFSKEEYSRLIDIRLSQRGISFANVFGILPKKTILSLEHSELLAISNSVYLGGFKQNVRQETP